MNYIDSLLGDFNIVKSVINEILRGDILIIN